MFNNIFEHASNIFSCGQQNFFLKVFFSLAMPPHVQLLILVQSSVIFQHTHMNIPFSMKWAMDQKKSFEIDRLFF
jgi:hypothetical protein